MTPDQRIFDELAVFEQAKAATARRIKRLLIESSKQRLPVLPVYDLVVCDFLKNLKEPPEIYRSGIVIARSTWDIISLDPDQMSRIPRYFPKGTMRTNYGLKGSEEVSPETYISLARPAMYYLTYYMKQAEKLKQR